MKVCKKCKKQLTNKIKICKFCGTDVSKAKIIKNTKSSKNNSKPLTKINVETIVNLPKENKVVKKQLNKDIKLKDKQKQSKIIERCKNIIKKIRQLLTKITESIIIVFQQKKVKIRIASIFVLTLLLTSIGYGLNLYSDINKAQNSLIIGQKATNQKIFGMGDLITHNGVDYKIIKVETSDGNSYKKPKEGNQFLIVTVYIKNNTSEKIKYSYENWTMSNSKDENKKITFTSLNVDTALYSGDLIIGGIKTGSMVFEQPKDDPKLRINFYDLIIDKNGNETINENKKIFSVSIKVPKESQSQVTKKNKNNIIIEKN